MNRRLLKKLILEQLPLAATAFALQMVLLIISCAVMASNTVMEYRIQIWIYGCAPVDYFLPLFATLPFVFSLYYKRWGGFLKYTGVRTRQESYVAQHMLAGFILCFLGVAAAYFVALLVCEFAIPFTRYPGYSAGLENYVFGNLQMEHPLLFGFGWCLWKGLNAGLFTLFGYALAIYVDNVFLVSISPFIYYLGENLVTSLFTVSQYSLATSLVLNRLSPSCMHVYNYLAGTIIFVLISYFIIQLVKLKTGADNEHLSNKK